MIDLLLSQQQCKHFESYYLQSEVLRVYLLTRSRNTFCLHNSFLHSNLNILNLNKTMYVVEEGQSLVLVNFCLIILSPETTIRNHT